MDRWLRAPATLSACGLAGWFLVTLSLVAAGMLLGLGLVLSLGVRFGVWSP